MSTKDPRPLEEYEDHEIIAEVFRRGLKLGDFAETLISDDAATLDALRGAMERPYDRPAPELRLVGSA